MKSNVLDGWVVNRQSKAMPRIALSIVMILNFINGLEEQSHCHSITVMAGMGEQEGGGGAVAAVVVVQEEKQQQQEY